MNWKPTTSVAAVSKQRYKYSRSCLVYTSHVIAAQELSLKGENNALISNFQGCKPQRIG